MGLGGLPGDCFHGYATRKVQSHVDNHGRVWYHEYPSELCPLCDPSKCLITYTTDVIEAPTRLSTQAVYPAFYPPDVGFLTHVNSIYTHPNTIL